MARTPLVRAEHVGSLLRPPSLLAARRAHAAGQLDTAGLRRVEDDAIAEAVRMQHDVGLPIVTDGELRRLFWNFDVLDALDGVEFVEPSADRPDVRPHLRVHDRVGRSVPLVADQFAALATLSTVTAKVTLPAPDYLHGRGRSTSIDTAAYTGVDDPLFFADVAAAYRAEIADLEAAGCRYLQLDDPNWAFLCDPVHRDHLQDTTGVDPDELVHRYAQVVNDALRGRSPELTVTMHSCRGNVAGRSMATGSYERVAEVWSSEVAVDGFALEFDGERGEDLSPLRHLPADRFAVLGLVSSRTGALEDPAALHRRIDDAARYVDLDQLALSPQCGFASMPPGNDLSAAEQAAKLRLVVEVADQVWG